MNLADVPCQRDCPRRSPTCHASCPDYAEFAAKAAAEREQRHREWERGHAERARQARWSSMAYKRRQRKERMGE